MTLVDELREGFASTAINSVQTIKTLPEEYPAYIIRLSEGYGAAIKVDEKMEVAERFNGCHLHTSSIAIAHEATGKYLILTSAFEEYRHEFAALCAEFVDPGKDGITRKKILDDPIKWWEGWKGLVGNTDYEQRVYSVIAEMSVLDHILKNDPSAVWAATRAGSHDIECNEESGEVKSTVRRYGYEIEISGQHQLECQKRLYLYFCRLEESLEGESINSMQKILENDGYDAGKLEIELEAQGFEKGASIRNKRYKILEKRKYLVDDNFPKIVKESFKQDKFPDGITKIQYTVDLQRIANYEVW